MVELQTCASLVNASALCPMEREVKGDGVNVIAEITAELERERQKNAQLLERISILEAQLQQRNKESLPTNGQGNSPTAIERSLRKPKRQKIEIASDGIENGHINKGETASQKMNDPQYLAQKETNLGDRLINWMSMDETQFLHFEKFKDGDSTADYDDTDDSDDEDDDYREDDDINRDYKVGITDDNSRIANELKEFLNEGVDEVTNIPCVENSSGGQNATTYTIINQETNEYQKENQVEADKQAVHDERELNILDQTLAKKTGAPSEILHTGPGSLSSQKKPPKMAFCPKEVKRIIESDILLQKNAQSHTIRKIIVFASLGIRHGCEDMYELDFNHFSILRKGESYVSPKNPGEHVLYENPGVRKKVFYPNRQNPTLCPVQILEEEKAMRPSDASCPSCLFLCIKYGGRTRNLPQNEYVRQRMGRNKLKSFGPLMCRIAKLVHIRSGSFFFKALGITLLFMAGFPDDLVQRETKYRNLDLLQKYYRTDEDAEGEELFHQHAPPYENQANAGSKQLSGKSVSTQARGRKKNRLNTKNNNLQIPTVLQSRTSSSVPSAQFGLIGCTPVHTQSMAALQSIPPQNPADAMAISNQMIPRTATNVSYQAPYQVFPQQQANAFLPIMYWPPPNTFAPGRYPSTYSLQSFPSTANYMSVHQQPYYSHNSSSLFTPNKVGGTEKNNVATEEADSDSDNSSSSTDPEEH